MLSENAFIDRVLRELKLHFLTFPPMILIQRSRFVLLWNRPNWSTNHCWLLLLSEHSWMMRLDSTPASSISIHTSISSPAVVSSFVFDWIWNGALRVKYLVSYSTGSIRWVEVTPSLTTVFNDGGIPIIPLAWEGAERWKATERRVPTIEHAATMHIMLLIVVFVIVMMWDGCRQEDNAALNRRSMSWIG